MTSTPPPSSQQWSSTYEEGRGVQGRLVTSPFVASFIGRARPGDVHDTDPDRRAAAWARWAIESLAEVSNGARDYPALFLPAEFYDPKGTGPKLRPHLEIPARVLNQPDPEFPDRLSQAGNGLTFPWWVYSEVTAVRRALFNTAPGPIRELVEVLNERHPSLQTGLELAVEVAAPQWQRIAALILQEADSLAADATGGFTTEEVAEYFPKAEDFGLTVVYDERLREKNGQWATRRVGVWQLCGTTDGGDNFSLGVITPRLTVNSLFNDPLFAPAAESPAALLVRALLLRRLTDRHLRGQVAYQVHAGDPQSEPKAPTTFLRAVVAHPGQKLPAASIEAAMNFLHTYPDPDAAWRALSHWADKGYLLTISKEGFAASHRAALRHVSRAEEPERDDIDNLLPLAWDVREGRSQVVRVTFTRAVDDDPSDSPF